MSNAIITQYHMNWDTETHKFTFHTYGDYLSALDQLGDLKGSLEDLYNHLILTYDTYEKQDTIPKSFRVTGGCSSTHIEETN